MRFRLLFLGVIAFMFVFFSGSMSLFSIVILSVVIIMMMTMGLKHVARSIPGVTFTRRDDKAQER
ncbi:MAG: hypothetical protein AAGJ31_08965 [Verrucomicrobiota bacterium]